MRNFGTWSLCQQQQGLFTQNTHGSSVVGAVRTHMGRSDVICRASAVQNLLVESYSFALFVIVIAS